MKETKFKVGDDVLVKGYIVGIDPDDDILKYKISLHGCDCIDNNWIARSSVVESIDDWELAARVAALPEEDFQAAFKEFGDDLTILGVFRRMTPAAVRDILNEYEQSKIQIGDLVEVEYCDGKELGIFAGETYGYYYLFFPGFKCVQKWDQSICTLTKIKHKAIDILGALENIKKLSEESEDKR